MCQASLDFCVCVRARVCVGGGGTVVFYFSLGEKQNIFPFESTHCKAPDLEFVFRISLKAKMSAWVPALELWGESGAGGFELHLRRRFPSKEDTVKPLQGVMNSS